METKKHIRSRALALRDGIPEDTRRRKSREIIKKVMDMREYADADILLTYRNYKSEVETEALIRQALSAGKKVYCPRINGEEMEFYRIEAEEELVKGLKGIPEPLKTEGRLLKDEDIKTRRCFVLMPGSAFDRDRNRIGYGKGYYDKYLSRYPFLHTVAVCFDCQMTREVPSQVHDRKPDMLVTETETIADNAPHRM